MSDINDSFDPDDYEGVQPRMAQLPRAEVRRFEKDRKERDALKAQMAAYEAGTTNQGGAIGTTSTGATGLGTLQR